jgi:enoyl-CoA hydratase/carnithine racemase
MKAAFERAHQQKDVQVFLFDSAPIKTFIAGANVPAFVENVKKGRFKEIRDDTARWQDILFHMVTGSGKPNVAIVDGATFGGGVEVALAFAQDPDSVVVITDRTSFALPETRLGIYPGLRGTLILPRLIYEATGDAELAVAVSRYYILAGGTATSSPRLIRYLGLADFLVPARKRDETADVLARAIIDNEGRPLDKDQLSSLGIEELPLDLTFDEKEELRLVKDLFIQKDPVATLYAYGRGFNEVVFSGDDKVWAERIARRVANNSPHAVGVADQLINRGFAGFLKGESIEELAKWELDYYFVPVFEHPDALEGMTAMVERRFPEFNRLFPF